MNRTLEATVVGVAVLLATLAFSYQYQWNATNSNGLVTYDMRAAGLPLQYLQFEVSSPVGPSSYFKVDTFSFVLDLLVWVGVAYVGLAYYARRSDGRPSSSAPTSA